jgi:AcrR family transcriptional regulator
VTKKARLTVSDWERAALAAIAAGGLHAVAVEPLARQLGVTKGSFYAHFKDRDDLIRAALRRWEAEHISSFETLLADATPPERRLREVVALASRAAAGRTVQGRLLLESDDPRVRDALRRVTERRLQGLKRLLEDLGHDAAAAQQRATLLYAAYIGLLQLGREIPSRLRPRRELEDALYDALAPPGREAARG